MARNDVLGEYAQLAAQWSFSVSVAQTFPLPDWRTAAELSQSIQARSKLVYRSVSCECFSARCQWLVVKVRSAR